MCLEKESGINLQILNHHSLRGMLWTERGKSCITSLLQNRACNSGKHQLHGKALHVQANQIFPWTIRRRTDSGEKVDGICVALLEVVAQKMGFSYTVTADVRHIVYQNGTPGAALGEVRVCTGIVNCPKVVLESLYSTRL